MGQFLTYETVVVIGTSANTTGNWFTVHPYNGTLRAITITTGGYYSTGAATTASSTSWMGSSTATTQSTGLSSTGFLTFYSVKTGANFIKVAPPGAGGATYYPLTGGHSSSGGLINSMSTAPFFAYPFPLVDDLLGISTTDGGGLSNGFVHTMKLTFEGSRY
jgi:hypothetical protein